MKQYCIIWKTVSINKKTIKMRNAIYRWSVQYKDNRDFKNGTFT